MSKKYYSRLATNLVMIKDNKILLQLRQNTGYMDGMYDAACSGHLEKGESIAAATVREAKEEIDITINEFDLELVQVIHSYKEDYLNTFFTVKSYIGEPKIMEPSKCSDLSWFDIDNLPENIIYRIKNVIKNIKNKLLYDDADFTQQKNKIEN